ncbi:MAG: M16 family metallopeptidase [Christensenellales bacterium]
MNSFIYQYPSGLRLVYKNLPGVRSVSIAVMVACGSNNENEKNNGISHFIEHMMFKGTHKRTAFEIVDEVDSMGAQINAFTSKQATCYYTIGMDEVAENCIAILSDIVLHSVFPQDEIEREKGVVLEEISMSEDDNADLVIENLSTAYFEGNSLSKTILGPRNNVKSFTRKDITDYIGANYVANDIVVSIVGNIDEQKAKDLVAKYFEGGFVSDKGRKWEDVRHQPVSRYVSKFKDIEQSNIAIAMPAYEYSNSLAMAMMLVNNIVGGGMSSRLFQEIREKQGLAYNVYSYPSTYINNGVNTIYIGTNPSSVHKSLTAVKNLVDDVRKNYLTKAELEKGIRQLKSAYVLGQESSSAQMKIFAKHALYTNRLFSIDEQLQRIDSITMDDVVQVVDDCFDLSKAVVSYVGQQVDGNLCECLH